MWNFKRIAFLGAAILALGFYIHYSDRHSHEASESRIRSRKILLLPDKNQINSLVIEKKGRDPIEVKKEGARWWIEKPFRYEAEDLVVDGLLSALTLTTWERSFSAGDVNLEEMGLDRPDQKITVTLTTSAGLEKKRLLIGREVPTGKYVYARWEESGEVYMLYDQFARSFDKSFYALRKKRIFEIAADEIYAVDVALEGRNFILIKRNGKWQAVAREPVAMELAKVETFLSDLTNLYAKEFLDGMDTKNPDLGLAGHKYAINLTKRDGTSLTLWVGKENKEKEAFYGLKEGEQAVLLIPAQKIKDLPRSVNFFRQREESAKKLELEKVRIEKAGKAASLVKVGGKWQFEAGQMQSAEKLNQAVSELIGYLQDEDFGEPDIEIKRPPFHSSAISVKLLTPDKKMQEYTFYKKDNTIVAKIPSQPGFCRLDENVWNEVDQYFQQVSNSRKV